MKPTFADKIKIFIRFTDHQNRLSFFGGWAIYTIAVWITNIIYQFLEGTATISWKQAELLLFGLPFSVLFLWSVCFIILTFFQDSFKNRLWLYLLPFFIFEILLNLGIYLFTSATFFYSYFIDMHTNLAIILYIYIPSIIVSILALAIESRARNTLPPSSGLLDD